MKRIPLFSKISSEIVGWAQADEEDYLRLSNFKWHMTADRRAVRAQGKGYKQMGRDVMRVRNQSYVRIEHLDGDTLNNQKSNLKVRKDSRSD